MLYDKTRPSKTIFPRALARVLMLDSNEEGLGCLALVLALVPVLLLMLALVLVLVLALALVLA